RAEGDKLVWTELTEPAWPEMAHPEWSAQVYGRARARLLSAPGGAGALGVERSELVAFRTDAIYMTTDPHWNDDGRPGRYRHVRTIPGPIKRPTTQRELLAVRDGA